MHSPAMDFNDDYSQSQSIDFSNNGGFPFAGRAGDRRQPISEDVIRALGSQLLKEENLKVQEIIVSAIGHIGKPEAHTRFTIDQLIKAFHQAKTNE